MVVDGSSHAVRAVVGEYRPGPRRGTLVAQVVIALGLTALYAAFDELSTVSRALLLLYLWTMVALTIGRAVRRPVETVITTDGLRLRRWRGWREVPWSQVSGIEHDEIARLFDPRAHRVRVRRHSGRPVTVHGLTAAAADILVAASGGRSPDDAGVRA